jgi:hypothetical protein
MAHKDKVLLNRKGIRAFEMKQIVHEASILKEMVGGSWQKRSSRPADGASHQMPS